jgi:hypothetical protein
MNHGRLALAALGGFLAYFVIGGLSFGLVPSLRSEFLKYPAVYRTEEGIKSVMPAGMLAMFVAIFALAVIYAKLYRGTSGLAEGATFGALIGVFAIGSFVVHNYVNLNIGLKLTAQQSVAYFLEWLVVGIVIGLGAQHVYPELRRAAPHLAKMSSLSGFIRRDLAHCFGVGGARRSASEITAIDRAPFFPIERTAK